MATGQRNDPYRSFNFRVEIDGLTVGSFSECSGLSSDGDAVDYREGTDLPLNVRKLVSLLLSIWFFGNKLAPGVLMGAAIVFVGGGLYAVPSSKPGVAQSKEEPKKEL